MVNGGDNKKCKYNKYESRGLLHTINKRTLSELLRISSLPLVLDDLRSQLLRCALMGNGVRLVRTRAINKPVFFHSPNLSFSFFRSNINYHLCLIGVLCTCGYLIGDVILNASEVKTTSRSWLTSFHMPNLNQNVFPYRSRIHLRDHHHSRFFTYLKKCIFLSCRLYSIVLVCECV